MCTSKAPLLLATLALLSAIITAPAAQPPSEDKIEAAYEAELQKSHPELVAPFKAARIAFDQNDFTKAATLLADICAKAPEWDIAARRYGSALVNSGSREDGLKWLERAVQLKRSPENLSRLAYYLAFDRHLQQDDPAAENRAMQLLREASAMPDAAQAEVFSIMAQLTLKHDNRPEFRKACAMLRRHAPDSMLTHYFSAIEAVFDEAWMAAEKEIRLAGKAGLPDEAVHKFLSSGVGIRAKGWRIAMYVGIVVAAWVVGLCALFGIGMVLSRITLNQAESADPRLNINPGERKLRQIYRSLINLAGVYYYLSLPIVVVMVIGIVGATFLAFMAAGWLPIKLMLILGIGALFTIFALLKSLFVRVKSEDPGRVLKREEAPALWQMTEEVARAVDTRPIDEIRITPGTEVAVYERGSWREKLQNKATRILILGTGVLNGFKQDDFRCVLAHEYGHFSNRDTAGGDIGLRVRNDMVKFYLAMCEAGQASMINAAFHFLRVYNFIFRRISHGATRLQEILADRVAAQCYGAKALEGGLKHVIRRSIEFDAVANHEIKSGLERGRPLQNLYQLNVPDSTGVETAYAEALNRKTTDDDTHPSPLDRFRLVAQLGTPSCGSRPGEVWDLFNDREGITQEMMALLESRVAHYRVQAAAPVPAGAA